MRITAIVLLGASLALPANLAQAAMGACTIEDGELVCAEGASDGSRIMEALAASATRSAFEQSLTDTVPYRDAQHREAYRQSLEAALARSTHHARRMKMRWRRRQITSDEYESVRRVYERAVENYRLGMRVYHEGLWRDATPRRR